MCVCAYAPTTEFPIRQRVNVGGVSGLLARHIALCGVWCVWLCVCLCACVCVCGQHVDVGGVSGLLARHIALCVWRVCKRV